MDRKQGMSCPRMMGILAVSLLFVPGCGGRSVGRAAADGGSSSLQDTGSGLLDGSPWVDDSGPLPCIDSPLLGTWTGSFTGDVNSASTGPLLVYGTLWLEVFCQEELVISGEMRAAESSGVTFHGFIEGGFDQATEVLDATMEGVVMSLPCAGNVVGRLTAHDPDLLRGDWSGRALTVDATGVGTWQAALD